MIDLVLERDPMRSLLLVQGNAVILSCVNYMSEADVADMCHSEGFFEGGEDDD